MNITDHTTLRAYIDKQLSKHTTVVDKAQARANLNLSIACITGLSPETISSATRSNERAFASRNYALINAAITDGRLPS